MVALLRAVNVGGRKLAMADLRDIAVGLGWQEVATYIQSGNLLFTAKGEPKALEDALERAIEARTGLKVPVIIRSAAQWAELAANEAFPTAAEESPNRLMLLLSKSTPTEGAEKAIQARADSGEKVKRIGDALWIHFPSGLGRSKLTPSVIDKAIGSPATARNYRTVQKLAEMLDI
jgi:uncharacterized protein (DUF1697 family)